MPRAAGGRGRQPPVLKKFGQHFLTDPTILSAIVDALAPTKTDTVVEIGPGRGSLTEILARRAGRLIAVDSGLPGRVENSLIGSPSHAAA